MLASKVIFGLSTTLIPIKNDLKRPFYIFRIVKSCFCPTSIDSIAVSSLGIQTELNEGFI